LSDENLMNEICDGKKKMIALTRLATADSVWNDSKICISM
jgi:hypothetical protein